MIAVFTFWDLPSLLFLKSHFLDGPQRARTPQDLKLWVLKILRLGSDLSSIYYIIM